MYRVIVVDDEKWSLAGISHTFRWGEYGFTLLASLLSPTAALELIEAEKPEAVFTDVRMPGMSGLELMAAVRARGLDTEFVIISGFSEFEYAKQAIGHRVFDYILKPVDQLQADGLLERLQQHLTEKGQAESRQAPSRNEVFAALLAYIQQNIDKPLMLKELAGKFYITPNHCCYLFQSQLDTTFSEYVTGLRMERARELLRSTDRHVYEIAAEVGYADPQYFNRVFRQENGSTPLMYRKRFRADSGEGENPWDGD